MDILVNGEKLKLGEYNTIDSLQGIIEFMDTHLGKGIVKAVEVDGEEYTVEEIEENKKLNMDEVSRVNFITAASDDLKSSIAFDIKEKLPQIRKDFKCGISRPFKVELPEMILHIRRYHQTHFGNKPAH